MSSHHVTGSAATQVPAVTRMSHTVSLRAGPPRYQVAMKLPARLRDLTRRTLGSGRAESIRPEALRELAVAEDVLVIAVGVLAAGTPDDQLPGEQRAASLLGLASAVADVPRERAIVLHCG